MSLEKRIWTLGFDGYCNPNPGLGGWGFVLTDGMKEWSASGAEPEETTNNRMEISGLLNGLDKLWTLQLVGEDINIIGDSQYVLNGASAWILKWKRKGWKLKNSPDPRRNEVKNLDLWKTVDALLGALRDHGNRFHWWWVRGHTGFWLNEKCDTLAELLVNNVERNERHFEAETTRPIDFSKCELLLRDQGQTKLWGELSDGRRTDKRSVGGSRLLLEKRIEEERETIALPKSQTHRSSPA